MFGKRKKSDISYHHEKVYGDEPHKIHVIPKNRKDFKRKYKNHSKYSGRYD